MEQLADGRYGPWKLVDMSWSKIIDGGDPNSNDNVFYVHPRGTDAPGGAHIQVAHVSILNRASAADFGWGVRLNKSSWTAGQWVHGTTTFTDDTADAQDAGTADFALDTLTNGDGYLVACNTIFSAISINGSQANTGAPARAVEYSTAGGTWTAAVTLGVTSAYTSGESFVWIQPVGNWIPMTAGHGTGVPVGKYGLRVRATTAPTQVALASTISVHRIYQVHRQLATNAYGTTNFGGFYAPLDPEGDAFVCITANPNVNNHCMALVRSRG